MRIQDLRIGNYFKEKNEEEIYKCQGIYTDNCDETIVYYSQFYMDIETCKPIPLTEEWLLKFGFEEYMDGLRLNSIVIRLEKSELWYVSKHNIVLNKIRYVHQLQNLYFALTGEELTVKELMK